MFSSDAWKQWLSLNSNNLVWIALVSGEVSIYRLVDEIMTVAFWIGSFVLLDAILILWLKRRLQDVEVLTWW